MSTTIVVLGLWTPPGGAVPPDGEITFQLDQDLIDLATGETIFAQTIPSPLVLGAIAQPLVANDAGVSPTNSQYRVDENLLGAPEQSYYATVPAVPPGSRSITDGAMTVGSQILESATANFTSADVGAFLFAPFLPIAVTVQSVIDSAHASLTSAPSENLSSLPVLIGASVLLSAIRPT